MPVPMFFKKFAFEGFAFSSDECANTEEGSNGEDQDRKQEYQVDGARIAYHNGRKS